MLHYQHRNSDKIKYTIQAMDRSLGQKNLLHEFKVTTEREDLSAKLANIKIPILYCYGNDDNLVDKEHIEKIVNNNKMIESLEIQQCGHMLTFEQPKQLAQIIIQWLK